MGYYTNYTLTVHNAHEGNIDQVRLWLYDKHLLNYVFYPMYDTVGKTYVFYSVEAQKWYEYDLDMLALSKQFPEIVFELDGQGEDNYDLWKAYFQNGDIEYCAAFIEYPKPKRIIPPQ